MFINPPTERNVSCSFSKRNGTAPSGLVRNGIVWNFSCNGTEQRHRFLHSERNGTEFMTRLPERNGTEFISQLLHRNGTERTDISGLFQLRQYPMLRTTPRGFEPLRLKTTHLAGEPLNHSGKVSCSLDLISMRSKLLGHILGKKQKSVKNLHVGESNPGRLRDRQKCYQLHQHGTDTSEFT